MQNAGSNFCVGRGKDIGKKNEKRSIEGREKGMKKNNYISRDAFAFFLSLTRTYF